MTGDDQIYFELCFKSGLVKSPFLEVGSAKVQKNTPNLCDLARSHGLEEIRGVDLQSGVGVDYVFDFSLETENFISKFPGGTYSTTAVFNVLQSILFTDPDADKCIVHYEIGWNNDHFYPSNLANP